MPIRVRLVISYIAMVAIPFVLSISAAIIIFGLLMGNSFSKEYESDNVSQIPQNVIKEYMEINQLATKDPDKFMDKGTLKEIDSKLLVANILMVVKNEQGIVYASEKMDINSISNKLPGFKGLGKESYAEIRDGVKSYTVVQRDFFFKNEKPGSIYLFADFGFLRDFISTYIRELGWIVFIILILTNGLITFFVSRSIIKPLKLLKYGTQQIKEGNLDFVMTATSRDEIGEVCVAFEEMRSKLKESIEWSKKYNMLP